MTILQDRAARPNLEMCRPMKPQTLVPVRAHGCSATVGEAAIGQRGEPAARDLAPIGAGPLGALLARLSRTFCRSV